MIPGLPKAVLVVKAPARFMENPGFTQMEIDWIQENVKDEKQLLFLWQARLDDPLWQVLPNSYYEKPRDPEPTPATKAAMQECFDFLGIKSKREKNT